MTPKSPMPFTPPLRVPMPHGLVNIQDKTPLAPAAPVVLPMESTAAATDTPPYLQQTFNIYEGDNYVDSTINGGAVGGAGNTNRAAGASE